MAITATVQKNKEHNGIEIYFSGEPAEDTKNNLKEHHWRYHRKKKCWYMYYSAENMNFANRIRNKYSFNSKNTENNKSNVKKKKCKRLKYVYVPDSKECRVAHTPAVVNEEDIHVESISKEREWGYYQAISPKDKRYQKKRSFFS